MNAYKEEIKRLVDTCENERSLWFKEGDPI